MRDKSLSIFLMVVFGISGGAVLMLAWLQPMPGTERILSTFIGSVGLGVAFSRAVFIKSSGTDVMVEAEVEDEH
ncbi:hypothetical protein ACFLU9_01870 [Chloroflexota bacterium]